MQAAPADPLPQPVPPASPAAGPAAAPLAGATAVAAQQNEPTSWMVEILRARTAYQASAATMKVADEMTRTTIDTIG